MLVHYRAIAHGGCKRGLNKGLYNRAVQRCSTGRRLYNRVVQGDCTWAVQQGCTRGPYKGAVQGLYNRAVQGDCTWAVHRAEQEGCTRGLCRGGGGGCTRGLYTGAVQEAVHGGCTNTVRETVRTESGPWEKNPFQHLGDEYRSNYDVIYALWIRTYAVSRQPRHLAKSVTPASPLTTFIPPTHTYRE